MADTEQTSSGSEKAGGATPPYIAFQSLKTLAGDFKQHDMPGRVDKTVLTRFSGGVGGQIVTALRFLGLIDDGKVPTPHFRELVEAFGTDQWPVVLAPIVRRSFSPMFQLNLQTATPGQFNEVFRKAYPAKEETARKCVSFFLNAAREAQIPISPYIVKNTKPRSGPTKKRSKTNGAREESGDGPDIAAANKGSSQRNPPPPPPPPPGNRSDDIASKLLEKFPAFDPEWSPEIQGKWFDGYERLLKMGDK